MCASGASGGSSLLALTLRDELAQRGNEVRACLLEGERHGTPGDIVLSGEDARYAARAYDIDPMFTGAIDQATQLVRAHDGAPFDILHLHSLQVFAAPAYLLRAARGVPYVVTLHGSDVLDERLLDRNRAVIAALLRSAAAVTCVSRYLADAFARKLPDLPRPEVIHNFLRRGFTPVLPLPRRRGRRLLHVSSLRPVKRPELLLAVFALVARRHPDSELRILTTRQGQRRAEDLLRGFEARERVTVLEGGDEQRLAAEYAQANAMVLTSRFESFGLVILEALACGIPVIAPAVAGIPEVLGEDWPLLVRGDTDDPSRYAELASAVDQALSPEELDARRHAILSRYDREHQTERYLAMYRRALSGEAGGDEACRG